MNNSGRVQIILKIFQYQFNILYGGLKQINSSDSMKLLSVLFNVKVKGYVVLSEVFHFIDGRDDISIELIKDYYFPCVVIFSENLFKKFFLNRNQI